MGFLALLVLASCDGSLEVLPPARSTRIAPPDAHLLGYGASACTNQIPPSGDGDRWCAFSLPGAAAGGTELWVMNVSRAAVGEPFACDGSNGNCLRLTGNLWTGQAFIGPSHPYAHRFDGDTLIFHADATSIGDDIYQGPVWAWRPGWARPRRLTGNDGLACQGHPNAAVAVCISALSFDETSPDGIFEFDFLAGAASGDGPLPKIDHLRPASWQTGFSRDGALFALSSRAPGQIHEDLRVAKTSDLGVAAPATILEDATRWWIANDGRKIYYLKGFASPSEDDAPVGQLMLADFPSGTSPTPLASGVTAFQLLGSGMDADHGVGIFQDVQFDTGTFRVIKNRDNPQDIVTIATGVDNVILSPDLRFSFYIKPDSHGIFDGYIVRTDGLGGCVLNAKPGFPALEPRFSTRSGLVFWHAGSEGTGNNEGWFGNPDGCTGRNKFSSSVGFMDVYQDKGLVFGDNADAATMNLRYFQVPQLSKAAQAPAPPSIIRDQIDTALVPINADPTHLLFTVSKGDPGDLGTYVYGPLGF